MSAREPIDPFTLQTIRNAPDWSDDSARLFLAAARAVHLLRYSAVEIAAFDRAGFLSEYDHDVLRMMRRTVVGEDVDALLAEVERLRVYERDAVARAAPGHAVVVGSTPPGEGPGGSTPLACVEDTHDRARLATDELPEREGS